MDFARPLVDGIDSVGLDSTQLLVEGLSNGIPVRTDDKSLSIMVKTTSVRRLNTSLIHGGEIPLSFSTIGISIQSSSPKPMKAYELVIAIIYLFHTSNMKEKTILYLKTLRLERN